ncbi:hypothetical protein Tco_0556875 [Tanacetum coccineum]
MDLYQSRLTQDDLKDMIIKYKIPHDLHPRLPSKEFVMFKLPDDAIGIYHRMIDFSGVRIPFSLFLLALIKHYRVHFSQLGPLGLNKGADGNVMGIHDFLCLSEWTGFEVQEEPHHDIRPTLQRLPFYYTYPAAVNVVILDPTPEDHPMGTPSAKILAKAEASQKRKASTSGATSSHVAKRTRFALAQSSSSTTRPSLFVGNSDDESDDVDACVEIPFVTPIRSAAVIPSSGNQGGSSVAPAAEGPGTRDSRGKGIMVDDVVAPPVGVSPPRPSFGPASSFRDVSEDAIHTYFFPFYVGPYYDVYPEGGVAGNCEFTRKEWDAPYRPTFGVLTKEVFKDLVVYKMVVDQFPIPRERVRVETLSEDQLTEKMSVLHCMICLMVVSSWLGIMVFSSLIMSLWLQRQVAGLSDKLSSSDAAFAKSKAKGKERKNKIKSLTKNLDQLNAEVTRLFTALNQATVPEAEKEEEILRLKATPLEFASFFRGQFQGLVLKFLDSDKFSRVQGELLSLAVSAGFERGLSMHRTKDEFTAVLKKMVHFVLVHRLVWLLASRDARVSPPIAKESIVTPASESLELPANVFLTSSAIASEQNEDAFVQGTSHVLDDVAEVTTVGSGRVSSSPTNVVVALSVGEKGDGSLLSSTADEEAAANPSRV